MTEAGGAVPGADGLLRCPWGTGLPNAPDYADYHDREWGRPVRGEVALFERISLEAFQAGLSWLTILRRREGFRAAFAGFDPVVVARFAADDVERLMVDAGIIRNRAKVLATIANARTVLALEGGLDALLWSFAPDASRPGPRTAADVPAVTTESTAMARELKARGFQFVGPTTAYALMQATGMVDDHLTDCVVRGVPPAQSPRKAASSLLLRSRTLCSSIGVQPSSRPGRPSA